jgi:hypothetical protein
LSLFFHLKRNKKFVIIASDKEIKEVINMGKMTLKDAARIQAATAKNNGGIVPKDSFSSRATSAAAKNSGKNK